MNKIGDEIRRLRTERPVGRSWTQAFLGRLCGVSRETVSRWESGRTTPGRRACDELDNAFAKGPGYFWRLVAKQRRVCGPGIRQAENGWGNSPRRATDKP